MNYTFERADKDLFAVYQTIYSEADIEMWFTWDDRLNDTKWSDDCYFLHCNGEKIGGAIINDGSVMFAFMIPPFCDRDLFWKLVINQVMAITTKDKVEFKGVLSTEVAVLQNLGVCIWRARQIMCRPTDNMSYSLPEGVYLEIATEKDIPELAEAQYSAYLGSIVFELFGEDSLEHIIDGLKNHSFKYYAETDSLDQFVVAKTTADHTIIGACNAGINPNMPNRFAGIDEVFVLPAHRGQGIAEAMIRHCINAAYAKTPVIKLHVLVNNPAVNLYRKFGFIAGPVFTDMKLERCHCDAN